MLFFWHNFYPNPIILSLGPIHLYWYGLCLVAGMIAGLLVALCLAPSYGIQKEKVVGFAFWLIIGGLIGARLYDVFLNWAYYQARPLDILKIWQGGLAIHGAIIAGLIVVWIFARYLRVGFWRLAALAVPGLALGQAIGRWGNYFNQELFGRPTSWPWGLAISPSQRPLAYADNIYFHPTFLYESLLCLLIFVCLLFWQKRAAKKEAINKRFFIWSTLGYVISYSVVRFLLEFIKIDEAPYLWGLRWPQIMSLFLIVASFSVLIIHSHARQSKKT